MRVCVHVCVLHVKQLILGMAVRLHSCMSRGCWLATAYHTPLQEHIVWPSKNFTFSIRSPGNGRGSGTAWHFCAPLKGRHLHWTCVRVRWWMDASEPQTEHSSFICGLNSKREANVSVGNRNTTPKRFLSYIWYFCRAVGEMSPSCGQFGLPRLHLCPSSSEPNTYLW